MSTDISSLVEAAFQGDWSPLIEESRNAPGKHWAEEARCANQDINLFVPLGDGPREDPEIVKHKLGVSLNRPRNLCASCPLSVAARCLVESLRDDDEFGIRAGLLASERSALRAAWQGRVNEEAVQAALHGSTTVLSRLERNAVIARFTGEPSFEPATVARGLGVTHEYLLKLVRRHRQKSQSVSAASSSVHSADAA
ncbi:WhiB family transcriptional regulator [Streptomyces rectiviolaceus]|uniref:4Fe-4S Wbl-type domain-containing protein n=1 Tax=Streptomyces rectiviolaceus TaxID=332591 RepID=A0ABP6M9W9_9ACTN